MCSASTVNKTSALTLFTILSYQNSLSKKHFPLFTVVVNRSIVVEYSNKCNTCIALHH